MEKRNTNLTDTSCLRVFNRNVLSSSGEAVMGPCHSKAKPIVRQLVVLPLVTPLRPSKTNALLNLMRARAPDQKHGGIGTRKIVYVFFLFPLSSSPDASYFCLYLKLCVCFTKNILTRFFLFNRNVRHLSTAGAWALSLLKRSLIVKIRAAALPSVCLLQRMWCRMAVSHARHSGHRGITTATQWNAKVSHTVDVRTWVHSLPSPNAKWVDAESSYVHSGNHQWRLGARRKIYRHGTTADRVGVREWSVMAASTGKCSPAGGNANGLIARRSDATWLRLMCMDFLRNDNVLHLLEHGITVSPGTGAWSSRARDVSAVFHSPPRGSVHVHARIKRW